MLFSLDYEKDFFLYTFSSDSPIVAVLAKKDIERNEKPISFINASLQWSKLNYLAINKQPYVVDKVVKHFRTYLLKAHTIIFMPHLVVRTPFM